MTLNVDLDERLQAFVCRQIESGHFPDASAVVQSALGLLESQEIDEAAKEEWLMQALEEGEASGLAEGDANDVMARVNERHGLPARIAQG